MSSVDNLALSESEGSLWDCCLSTLKTALGDSAFYAWIEILDYRGLDGELAVLCAPNELARNWVEKHYEPVISATIRKTDPLIQGVRFEVRTQVLKPRSLEIKAKDLHDLRPAAKLPAVLRPQVKQDRERQIGQFYLDYRFETFVVGECNRMAHSVCRTVAEAPGTNHYNPLVLYGRSGLGKTHLLQGIGRFALEHETAQRVVYRTADDFLKDYMRSVRERRTEEFCRSYEQCDMLILDDLQFLAKKERTQEELYKILNRLLGKKKQVVLSCDQLPSEVQGLDQRLLNRFESGLCCSLNPMDLQTRLDFLHRKASSEGFALTLSEESFRWLASHFHSNVRELEGVLVKLLGLREIMNMELTFENVRRMVGEVVRSQSRSLSLSSITEATAQSFGVKAELLAAKSRVQALALPRKVAIKLCRELTDHSLETIGYQFNRDYSTVIASLKALDLEMETDLVLRDHVEQIRLGLLA